MRYTRIYADAEGESHFEDVEVGLVSKSYAPPAPPFDLSDPVAADRVTFFSLDRGWFGDWHPAPVRQFYFNLGGRIEVEVSDGEIRQLEPGDVALTDDLSGRGHTTRVIGDEPSVGAFVRLDPEGPAA